MYRVLRAEGQVRERRAQAAHPPRVRPELVATGPSQVWSWDITKLKGPWRGIWLDLPHSVPIGGLAANIHSMGPHSGSVGLK